MKNAKQSLGVLAAISAGSASAQSVAEYTFAQSAFFAGVDESVTITVFGQATAGQIGNASGINGVNLSIDITNGAVADLDSIVSNSQVFGTTNVAADAGGFDISFSANSFAGNNFDAVALFSFNVVVTEFQTIFVTSDQGTLSSFNTATGLPGAFQPSVPYDVVNHGLAIINIPTPGAAAAFGLVGIGAARRRR
ncbi:MAG: hypothetical protein AAGI53_16085 [Planctomycetota bacterium]